MTVSVADREWLHGETAESPFDPLRLRRGMWDRLERGTAVLECHVCPFGKVLCLHAGEDPPVPWDDWGRILAAFYEGRPFRVGFFAAEAVRRLGHELQSSTPWMLRGDLGPGCVNGGYTMPCRSDTIVIYRTEEATRVLLHELFHATCCDRDLPLPEREAENEAWAEWVLVAMHGPTERRFAEQVAWVGGQNAVLRKKYGVRAPTDYLWRYTVGREDAYRRLGYGGPFPRSGSSGGSARLGCPTLE